MGQDASLIRGPGELSTCLHGALFTTEALIKVSADVSRDVHTTFWCVYISVCVNPIGPRGLFSAT